MDRLRNPSRRNLFRIAGAGGVALGVPRTSFSVPVPSARPAPATYAFFTPHEAAIIEAACARLIPADDLGPGALEAGVPAFIDRQLAGAWGAGERLYRSGPWREGKPEQGYQLPFTPAQLFRHALRSIEADLAPRGGFAALSIAEQDAYLKRLEEGGVAMQPVPAKQFFEILLDVTIEGFFGDPVYGGNRGMAGWKLIGFPGAYSYYYDLVDRHGLAFRAEPMSLAHGAAGHGASHGGKR